MVTTNWTVGDRCEVRPAPGTGPVVLGGLQWWTAIVTRVQEHGAGQVVEVKLNESPGSKMVAVTDVAPGFELIRPLADGSQACP